MRKGSLLILTLSLAFASSAWAGPRSWQQAKAIAKQQAAKLGITLDEDATSDAKANGQSSTATNASYYVFANNSKGYVIVSGDDVMPEVVGYSTDGTYDESQLPDNYVAFLKAYDATVKAVQNGNKIAISNVEIAKQRRAANTAKAVAPLLEKDNINWNQLEPYNLMCPTYTDTKGATHRTVTGCVATAMAQIMRYYKYPAATTAEIPAYTTETKAINVDAIPAGTTFDWDNMLGTYKEGNYTEAQGNAVAQLMLACGCSKKMDYTAEGSGTGFYVASQYANYFGYNPYLIQDVDRAAFTYDGWTGLIDNELANARPILYMGASRTAGHAFVCDGSDGNGLYHINWGWGGYQNNYFDLAILNPEKGGTGSGSDADGYTCDVSMTIGITSDQTIRPEKPLADYAPISIINYSTAFGTDFEDAFTLTTYKRSAPSEDFKAEIYSCFYVNHGDKFTGTVGYGIKNDDGTYTCIISADMKDCPRGNGIEFVKELSYAFPVGNTILYPIYKAQGEDTWKRCVAQDIIPVMVTATETEAEAGLAVEGTISFDSDLYTGVPSIATIELENLQDEEYYGAAEMYFVNALEQYASTGSLDLSLPAHGKKTLSVSVSPTISGEGAFLVVDTERRGFYKDVTINTSEEAKLKLVKVETNADVEETTAINYIISDNHTTKNVSLTVPVIKHDEITVTYTIQNDATTPGALPYGIAAFNTLDSDKYKQVTKTIRAEGNGATTTVSATFSKEDIGQEVRAQLKVYNKDTKKYEFLATDLPMNSYDMDGGKIWTLNTDAAIVIAHIAGEDASGIAAATTENGSYVAGGNGVIYVKSAEAKHLNIFNLSGQKVAELSLNAGEQQTITVRPGIYIVDGTKVAVK